MQIRSVMTSLFATENVLETWHKKYASQKKQNDTHSAVAMTTVLLLVLC